MGQLVEELILKSDNYTKNINSAINRLDELKRKSNTTSGGIGSLSKSLGGLGGALTKVAGVFGVAMGASEAFGKMLNSSQTLADEFGASQQALTTIVDNFFQSMANADFSVFDNGLSNIISRAKEAYQAFDDLFNMSQSFSVQNARLNNQFQKNINEIRQKKDSTNPQDQARVKELTEQNKRIIEQQTKGGMKLYDQTIKGLQAEIAAGTGMASKISESAIYRIVENDIDALKDGRARYEKQYKQYESKRAALQKKYRDKSKETNAVSVGGGFSQTQSSYGKGYIEELTKLQNKYGEAIAANYLLQRKSDEELQAFNDKLKAGLQSQSQGISNQSKMIRYAKEDSVAKGGKAGGTKSAAPVYDTGSIGWYEQEIARLQKGIKFKTDTTEIEAAQREIKSLQDSLASLTHPQTIKIERIDISPVSFTKTLQQMQGEMAEIKIPVRSVKDQYEQLVSGLHNTLQMYDIGMIGEQKAKELVASINEEIKKLGLKPLDVRVTTNADKELGQITSAVGSLGDSFSMLGNAIQLPELNAMGIISSAVANVMSGFAQALASPANTVGGVFTWIAASVAGLAQVANIVSQIHSMSGFANGGIVQGSGGFVGDRNLIRVNSGEAVLTKGQQANLWRMLDGGAGSVGKGGNVTFTIAGSTLKGVLRNHDNKMNKVK